MRVHRVAIAMLGLGLLLIPSPAAATMSGPCLVAQVGGRDLADLSDTDASQAIVVRSGETLTYRFESQGLVTHYDGVLDYGPFSIKIGEGNPNPPEATSSGSFDLTSFRSLGAGLYHVRAHVDLNSGGTCDGAFLLRVEGNPLATVLGISSLVVGLAAVAAVIGVTIQTVAGVTALSVDPRLKP